MLRGLEWPEASPGGARGATGSLHLGGQKSLDKKYNFDVRDAHELPHTSIRSSLATRPHHSNLYGKIERFVRFLREDDVQAGASPTVAQLIARD
jgi:hypothetical protein